ncbi:MAG: 5-formyltetrahydrofolate cyclo-ligase [Balneola sp.]|nr:5-formyltetrahydrofolate cyclo-ligase [Balneola sp.]|tara:strand:+ start:59827 stop:60405 length:579 start_codon:yes stop_codon:yes gene_type:complete
MSSLQEQKQALRNRVLSDRKEMPEQDWRERSLAILRSLESTEFFKKADSVHTYVSMNQRREVGTDQLIETLLESDKRVVVPVTNFSDHSLTHIVLHSFGELITNKWGVREPEKEQDEVQPENLDLIIVPMAAGDRKGNRLGYGQGFYDRFLEQTMGMKVGLVFSDFLFDKIPAEEFDVKLDVIITEEELIFL